MNLETAISILGINRTRDNDIRPMVKALGLHSWNNTTDDDGRLAAGKFVLRHWSRYQAECNVRRDRR